MSAQDDAKEALLEAIKTNAEDTENADVLQKLAFAYALVVGARNGVQPGMPIIKTG